MKKPESPSWCHGSPDKGWSDSGWVFNGKFYPCLYTSTDGEDKRIGMELTAKFEKQLRNYLKMRIIRLVQNEYDNAVYSLIDMEKSLAAKEAEKKVIEKYEDNISGLGEINLDSYRNSVKIWKDEVDSAKETLEYATKTFIVEE